MDQSSAPQNPMSNLHRDSITPGALPSEYWNNIDALYTESDQHQHQHPPPQPQQQQPLGISWDHPVFRQQHQQQHQSTQEPNHGIYSQSPQSWHQNPLQQPLISPTQEFGIPTQYHEVHHYPQGHVAYDTPYSFSQSYYPSQPLPVADTFSQQSSPQPIQPRQTPQPAAYQPATNPPATHQTSITQYTIPAGYSEGLSHPPIDFRNSYHEPAANVAEQQTINPQFLNAPQQSSSNQLRPSKQSNFLYVGPADFERKNNGRVLNNFYREDAPMPSTSARNAIDDSIDFTDGVAVVIRNNRAPALTKPAAGPRKKKATSKTMKGVSETSGKMSASSSSDSESSDDSDLEILPEEPSPIPATRPSEPVAAVQYDTLKAVWFPRNRRPDVNKIKSALVAFKDVVKAVRDSWKEKSQAMKAAENKGENDKATELKKDVVLQRRLMDVVVSTTLEKGHPIIVEKLGEHPMAVTAIYSFLLDRHHASDIDGALTVNILKLLARFVTMDEDTLQKTNVSKLLPRFLKKGGQTVKELSQKILDNATASTKRKQETGRAGSKEGSPSKSPAPNGAAVNGPRTELAGSKRLREGESNGLPATKRVVVASNIKNATKPANAGNNVTAKRPQETAHNTKIAPRPKANIIAPKPTNLFGSLTSASKRPGTSNAERAAAAAAAAKASAAAEKKEKALPAPKQPTFSFGDLIADLNKPKEPVVAKPAEDRPPETEEERKKRLRKEERRKLRVSWKPDHCLTEVRLFTHDPEEELGPSDGMRREVGDVKGEGSVLKLHRDLDDEDDEEDVGARESELLPYHEPLETDFGEIMDEDRSRSFIKRGGTQQPDSPEKLAQEHREATTLMVFYTSPADIPPSPKEPPPPSPAEHVREQLPFGEPPDHIKARQERYYSMVKHKPTAPSQPSAPNSQDISNLLKIIQNAPQQQQQATFAPQPQPLQQLTAMSDLERTVNLFRQQQTQTQLPQMPQVPATQPATMQTPDFQQILAIINAQKQMQQQLAQPPQRPPQQPQPAIAPNLAAVISQLTNPNQQVAPNQSQWQSSPYDESERKRMREAGGGYDGASDSRYSKRSRMGDPKSKKHLRVGSVPCKFWLEGKCVRGDACTFRHDPLD